MYGNIISKQFTPFTNAYLTVFKLKFKKKILNKFELKTNVGK